MTAHWRQNPGERTMSSQISETELYAPVKAFLEAQGYEVKAEVGPPMWWPCATAMRR
jgi:hypothetical protein